MSIKEGKQEEKDLVEIEKTMIIGASPEIVFKAITDPDELTNWFPDQAILEPRVGGKMKFSFFKGPKNVHKNMVFIRRSYYRIYTK
jgi:uncharacterized protein YndB with AHSA1/START domain